jgi:hypothetical protein
MNAQQLAARAAPVARSTRSRTQATCAAAAPRAAAARRGAVVMRSAATDAIIESMKTLTVSVAGDDTCCVTLWRLGCRARALQGAERAQCPPA